MRMRHSPTKCIIRSHDGMTCKNIERKKGMTDSFLEERHCLSWEVERPTIVSLIFSIRQEKQLYWKAQKFDLIDIVRQRQANVKVLSWTGAQQMFII
jgi:hypothetical protein